MKKEPLQNSRFIVEIDGIQRSGFTEVSLFDSNTDYIEYREGTHPNFFQKLGGLRRFGIITLKTGVTDSMELSQWYQNFAKAPSENMKKNISIVVLNSEGTEAARFNITGAWPVRYAVGPLNAKRSKFMNAHGELTSETAQAITVEMNKRGFDVYYDHGDPSNPFVGTIPVSTEKELSSKNQVSQLDIAVVESQTNKAVALIEIEETTETPKTLIGDIFATLMGNSVHLPDREKKVKVGNWTTLIILGKGVGHDNRIKQIENKANNVQSAFGTENSQIGKIVIEAFSENKPLKDVLMKKIEEAIRRSA